MGIRTRLQSTAGSESNPSSSVTGLSERLAVQETAIRARRPKREQPQVHLSHGRGLYQFHQFSEGSQAILPDGEAVIDSAPPQPLPSPSKHAMKREKLLERWKKLIPNCVEPYLTVLQDTESLQLQPPLRVRTNSCLCCRYARELEIEIVRFNKYDKIKLWASDCAPAAQQLIRSGLFPCAPVHPTLAVDLHMLDFVTRLFLRVAPNNTAWCGAVEDYLRSQGYKLRGEDPLRRRFGNALQWFNSLQHAVGVHMKSILEETRAEIRNSTQYPVPGSVASPRTPRVFVEEVEDEESPGHAHP
ncbi:hypothetical protein VKT23_016847 [Stygiomarasmius scandens]|uniref:CxC1-like cysteine cluster associated with KDZ transposases domain-containing protein n=1 Tax=Marasmiellus scandens TaxID=2682957 RepID=A0ABR1IXY8_9AGAR